MYNFLASAQKQLSAADIVSWIQLWNINKEKGSHCHTWLYNVCQENVGLIATNKNGNANHSRPGSKQFKLEKQFFSHLRCQGFL